ncbi:hypothetical protein PoB_006182200 [Plakobranchus ocellatus]|uniref:Uncharacterized protein n=1 Tax=Plakobranchus ocellatus TaxID=259542 RepID=A0AAV4CTU8_9GAST|nr:hypothetical protein PoB_006182200 [Plakobranchus ocellatus]
MFSSLHKQLSTGIVARDILYPTLTATHQWSGEGFFAAHTNKNLPIQSGWGCSAPPLFCSPQNCPENIFGADFLRDANLSPAMIHLYWLRSEEPK